MGNFGWTFTSLLPSFLTNYRVLSASNDMAVRSFPMWEGARVHKHYSVHNGAPYGSEQFIPKIEFDPCLRYPITSPEYDSCEEATTNITPPGWDGKTAVHHNGMQVFYPAEDAASKPATGKTGVELMEAMQPSGPIVSKPLPTLATKPPVAHPIKTTAKSNTMMYVGVGIAIVAVVGAIIFFQSE